MPILKGQIPDNFYEVGDLALRNMDLIKYRTSPLLRIPSPFTERGIKGERFHIKFVLYLIHIPKHG
jgi:hypothetical protein